MSLKEQLDKERIPQHVAIIMDGNGRWANMQGRQRLEGHAAGAQAAKAIVKAADAIGIKYITLYAFSMENWNRPQSEVSGLMDLLSASIANTFKELVEGNVRLLIIGDTQLLPGKLRAEIGNVVEASKSNTGLTVVIALSYGSRYEILQAAKSLLREYSGKPFDIEKLGEEDFASHLYTAGIPDPELLIRTSGEYRISNFLLWQISYSELYFTDVLWPDFDAEELYKAVYDYQHRERRFGKTSQQINESK